ncbi:MAG: hypothetical protein ABIF08_01045 [Nanoarchaeota archaeon]
MVQIRKIDEKRLDKMVREVVARGEGVRSFQNAKQAVIDEFKNEHERYKTGNISERALNVSSQRVTKELSLLDAKIRNEVKKAVSNARGAERYMNVYLPERIRASIKGVAKTSAKRKRAAARKTATEKTARRAVRRPAKRTARRKTTARKTAKRRTTARRTTKRRKR